MTLNLIQDQSKAINAFSICHWNLNSISAHNYAKIFLLKAYLAIHKFDIICISESYLNSNLLPDDSNLEVSSYNLTRSDHPSNIINIIYIINTFYLCEFSIFNVCKNLLFLATGDFKGTLSSLRQFLVSESPLKMMRDAFYFTLKACLVLKIFTFLSWIFGQVEKRLD